MSNTLNTKLILQPFGMLICQCLSVLLGYVLLTRWPEALKLSVSISPKLRDSGILMILYGFSDLYKVLFLTLSSVMFVMVSFGLLKDKEKPIIIIKEQAKS